MDDATEKMIVTLGAGIIKKLLITAGAALATHGVIASNQTETFVSAGMFIVGVGWSLWNDYGKAIVLSQLEVLKAKALAQAAKMREAGVNPVTVTQIARQSDKLTPMSVSKTVQTLPPEVQKNVADGVIIKLLLIAFLPLALLAISSGAHAQATRRAPAADPFRQLGDKIKSDLDNADKQVKQAVTPSDPKAALPCMDISMITRLTPQNLVPTMKACVQDLNNQLVSDTQRALDSAKEFSGSATGGGSSVVGDNDAINCLTPALALFKAAAIIPAVPAQDAVMNPDGTVKTPAVAAVPEIDPGPVLLYQKYREFTLAGALTSCQAWFNGPINATASAGVGAVGTAIAGAALLAPK